VEASPEQMARCSAVADAFSAETGTLTRVVGWYHSHPHITVSWIPVSHLLGAQALCRQLARLTSAGDLGGSIRKSRRHLARSEEAM